MRVVIDLHGSTRFFLSSSGRFAQALTKALAVTSSQDRDVWVSLNGSAPDVKLRRTIAERLVPNDRIHESQASFSDPTGPWQENVTEVMRVYGQGELEPDWVHRTWEVGSGLLDFPSRSWLRSLFIEDIEALDSADLKEIAKADLVLLGSVAGRDRARTLLPLPANRVQSISPILPSSMADGSSDLEELRLRHGIAAPYIIASTDSGPRSKLDQLLAVYAALPQSIRQNHQLVILDPCGFQPSAGVWGELSKALGLQHGEVVWLPLSEIEHVPALLKSCHLYVSLAEHEGSFDYSLVKALSNGSPVVCADLAANREILGKSNSLSDPTLDEHLWEKLYSILSDDHSHRELLTEVALKSREFKENTADSIWQLFESISDEIRQSKVESFASKSKARPRLALVSPFPPERTGIADYCAELAPELLKYYDVELVIKQSKLSPELSKDFPIRDWDWFDRHADRYDRIVYQLGNSPFHWHMWDLLERHPGVVIMHDFFMGNALAEWEMSGQRPNALPKGLYASHGYKPLIERTKDKGPYDIILHYPANFALVQGADGMVVHSQLALDFGNAWYGPSTSQRWAKIPLLRKPAPHVDGKEARAKLSIHEDAFVVCSFGGLSHHKMNHQLADAWGKSELASNPNCHLYFVGDNGGNFSFPGERIHITGYADQELYRAYLAAADVSVQLRTKSRGETSAAVLDCLLKGIPTIVNANGSMAELPDDTVIKLADNFAQDDLVAALNRLHADKVLRKTLAQCAKTYMEQEHAPHIVAEKHWHAIERFHRQSWYSRRVDAALALKGVARRTLHTKQEEQEANEALRANSRRIRQKQLFVDVTAVYENDIKTGIQRVVRAIAVALLANPPAGYRVEPVLYTNRDVVYARDFACNLLGVPPFLDDAPIEVFPGDIFLGLDLNHHVVGSEERIRRIQSQGAKVYFCIYDILPILRKDCFPPDVGVWFRNWTETVSKTADGIFCISKAVANEFADWLDLNRPDRTEPLPLGYFHLGANFESSVPTRGGEEAVQEVQNFINGRTVFLMVSTVEPRKGYAQAIESFDYLWGLGNDVVLIIIGKPGWKKGGVIDRLRSHPENGKRLLWLESASDEVLQKVYGMATALLFASEGEGFGLPLIEAARYGVPLIVRDIPVFREVAGDQAFYFSGMRPIDLAEAVLDWVELNKNGKVPTSQGLPYLSWEQSAQQVCKVVLESNWVRTWGG